MKHWFSSLFLLGLAACGSAKTVPASPLGKEIPDAGGWSDIWSDDTRALLGYWVPEGTGHTRTLMLSCQGTDIKLMVRGLRPAQAFPQPPLEVGFGAVSRSKTPTATWLPDVRTAGRLIDRREPVGEVSPSDVSYEYEVAIADDVLDAIGDGEAVKVTFNGQTRDFGRPPPAMARDFQFKCGSFVPPRMRAVHRAAPRGATS